MPGNDFNGSSSDHVQMRDGSEFNGAVVTLRISFQMDGGGDLSIEIGNVVRISFDFTGDGHDQVLLKDGTEVRGRVTEPSILFDSETLGRLTLRPQQMLALQRLGNL